MPVKLFFGWIIVGASFVILTVAYGLQFSYGVFLPFLANDLGLDRASAAAPLSLYILVYSLLSFVTGQVTDKLGPRIVVLAGGVLLGLGYVLLGSVSDSAQIYLYLGLIAGVGMSAAFIPLNATVVKWFVRRRGLALAITGSGVNAAVLVGPMLAAALIPWLGWRASLAALGLGGGLLILICAMTLVRDPETRNLEPDGDAGNAAGGDAGAMSEEVFWTLSEARKAVAFWIILGVFLLTWTILFFPYVHLPVLATDLGFSSTTAASLVGVMGVGGFGGRMVISWLGDLVGRERGLYFALAAQVLGCVVFSITDSLPFLYLAATLFSVGASSAITLFPAIVGDIFGRLHVGAITGFIFAIAGSAAAVGPFAAGLIRDETGSYDMAFLIGAAFNVVAIVLVAVLRPPQKD